MRKLLAIVLALCLMSIPCFAEETDLSVYTWITLGSTDRGISFPVPQNAEFIAPSDEERAAGVITVCSNDDFTLHLQSFASATTPWEDFKNSVLNDTTVKTEFFGEEQNVLYIKNAAPTADSTLATIALDGLDGHIYKIMLFAGIDKNIAPEATVWEIAQTIAAHTRQIDFSALPAREPAAADESSETPAQETTAAETASDAPAQETAAEASSESPAQESTASGT